MFTTRYSQPELFDNLVIRDQRFSQLVIHSQRCLEQFRYSQPEISYTFSLFTTRDFLLSALAQRWRRRRDGYRIRAGRGLLGVLQTMQGHTAFFLDNADPQALFGHELWKVSEKA